MGHGTSDGTAVNKVGDEGVDVGDDDPDGVRVVDVTIGSDVGGGSFAGESGGTVVVSELRSVGVDGDIDGTEEAGLVLVAAVVAVVVVDSVVVVGGSVA